MKLELQKIKDRREAIRNNYLELAQGIWSSEMEIERKDSKVRVEYNKYRNEDRHLERLEQMIQTVIDDTKDSDFTNTHDKEDKKKTLEVISEAQAKRMYMLAKGKDTNMVKQILANYGFNESRDITKDKYNYICEQIEAI